MKKEFLKLIYIMIIFYPLLFISCSDDMGKFQSNDIADENMSQDPGEEAFDLIVENDPLLSEAFGDVSEHQFSQYAYDFIPELYENLSMKRIYLLNTLFRVHDMLTAESSGIPKNYIPGIMLNLKDILERVINQNRDDITGTNRKTYGIDPVVPYLDYPSGNDFKTNLYSLVDLLDGTELNITDDVIDITKKILYYINDSFGLGYDTYGISYTSSDEIEEIIHDLRAFLSDSTYTSIGSVMRLTGEILGKLLLRANDNMWIDGSSNLITGRSQYGTGTDTGLGNAARGMDALFSGLNDLAQDEEVKQDVFDILRSAGNLLAASSVTDINMKAGDVLKDLICNLEDYFTVDGAVYGTAAASNDYHRNTTALYVNAELGNTLNELYPLVNQLLMKGSRADSVIEGDSYPLELLAKALSENADGRGMNIDFDTLNLEESLYAMARYDENFNDRRASGSEFTALDKLIWMLTAVNTIGFKVSESCGDQLGTKPNNHGRGHGDPVPYVTVSDALYNIRTATPQEMGTELGSRMGGLVSMLGGALHSLLYTLTGLELNVYDLYFDNPTGNLVWRHPDAFAANDVESSATPETYHFYTQTNSPVLALAGGECAGDIGLPAPGDAAYNASYPAGGQSHSTSVIPVWEDTPASNRVFVPYSKDGKGDVNAVSWILGWLVRACWSGYGPYYSTEDEESLGGGIYRYYCPNGTKVYAEVNKSSGNPASWSYSNTDYKGEWNTDRFLLKLADTGYDPDHPDTARAATTRYYALENDEYRNGSPDKTHMGCDPNSYSQWAVMHGRFGYTLASNPSADGIHVTEKIGASGTDQSMRQCSTYEEAIYKNLQWLLYEKKFVLPLPVMVDLNVSLLSMVTIRGKVAAFIIVEGNGVMGVLNAHKVESTSGINGNGKWAKDGGYNESTIPGDYRVTLMLGGNEMWSNTVSLFEFLAPDLYGFNFLDISMLYNLLLKTGTLLPAVLAENVSVMKLLMFLDQNAVTADPPLSSQVCGTASPYWNSRNALVPVLIALLGSVHENASTVPTISGQEFPRTVEVFRTARELLKVLSKPLFYYQKASGDTPQQCWKPKMPDSYDGNDYLKSQLDVATPSTYFKPKFNRTLLSVLAENNPLVAAERANGLLSMLPNERILSRLLSIFQRLGSAGYDDPVTAVDDDYRTWGARKKFFFGLEQIATSIKPPKGEMIVNNYMDMTFPNWMFTNNGTRNEDVLHQNIINELIGNTNLKGLRAFPDSRPLEADWDNFYLLINSLGEILSDSGQETAGAYNIMDELINVIDKILTGVEAEDEHIQAVRHTLGSIFARYDTGTGTWIYPDEGVDILTDKLPAIMGYFAEYSESASPNVPANPDPRYLDGYYALMKVLFGDLKYDGSLGTDAGDWYLNYRWDEGLLKEDGLVEYMINNFDMDKNADELFPALQAILGYMGNENPFWDQFTGLLEEVLAQWDWNSTPHGD